MEQIWNELGALNYLAIEKVVDVVPNNSSRLHIRAVLTTDRDSRDQISAFVIYSYNTKQNSPI